MVSKHLPIQNQRISSLDLLRGFALLGILIMNIISFSNVGIAYLNPTEGAGIEGVNAYFHGFGYLFADTRFMSLFSILFGAGVILFAQRAKAKGLSVWKYHYRRMGLLLIFGFMHAYLIWMGDILVAYAICGSFVFLLRHKSNRTLMIWAILLFIVPLFLNLSNYVFTPTEVLEDMFSFYYPTEERIAAEVTAYRSNYLGQMDARIEGAIELQTLLFLTEQMWRVLSMMLVGMMLFKNGILSGERSDRFYKKMTINGLCFGLVISMAGLYFSYKMQWKGTWVMCVGHTFNYVASLIMAFGYIGLIVLWSKSQMFINLKVGFQNIGRMAFTNYILTSIICTTIFYGHGLGCFAKMNRPQTYLVVFAIWILLFFFSKWVFSKWRQGPLEWIWRKGTYI